MRLLAATLALATVLTACLAIEQQPPVAAINSKAQQTQQQLSNERQGRSISTSGNAGNNLSSSSESNSIEHSGLRKAFLEKEKRDVQEFLTTKNIFKSLVKLLFGHQQEVGATSRQVLSMVSKVLDLLKNTFGQKSRSGTARTIRDSAEDAASAGVSMLQGYVKSVLTDEPKCAMRHLCMASREAIKDGRDLGYVVATVGGYATSYLLDSARTAQFNNYYDASLKGRGLKDDCMKLYECSESAM